MVSIEQIAVFWLSTTKMFKKIDDHLKDSHLVINADERMLSMEMRDNFTCIANGSIHDFSTAQIQLQQKLLHH